MFLWLPLVLRHIHETSLPHKNHVNQSKALNMLIMNHTYHTFCISENDEVCWSLTWQILLTSRSIHTFIQARYVDKQEHRSLRSFMVVMWPRYQGSVISMDNGNKRLLIFLFRRAFKVLTLLSNTSYFFLLKTFFYILFFFFLHFLIFFFWFSNLFLLFWRKSFSLFSPTWTIPYLLWMLIEIFQKISWFQGYIQGKIEYIIYELFMIFKAIEQYPLSGLPNVLFSSLMIDSLS